MEFFTTVTVPSLALVVSVTAPGILFLTVVVMEPSGLVVVVVVVLDPPSSPPPELV